MTAKRPNLVLICTDQQHHASLHDRSRLRPRASADYIARDHDCPFALMVHLMNPHDICYMAIRESQQTEAEALEEAIALPPGVSRDEFFEKYRPPIPGNFEPQDGEPMSITELVNRRRFRVTARTW